MSQISGSADQRISGPADQRIIGPVDQRISESADQRISGPNQEIHGSARPRILQSAIFLYSTCQLLSTHAPAFRSLQVHSPRNCTFDKLVHVISNIMITSCMSFWQPSSTLSDVWDLLFEEPYPTLSVVIQSWMCGLMSSSLPLRCLVW